MEEINFEDWVKLDLRVGQIIEVKDHPNANKLYILTVDVGEKIELVSGLKEQYTKEDLEDKMVIVLVNLAPKELRGVKSRGMVLAAVEGEKISLLRPDKIIKPGTKID